jgi:hypothetical protein
MLILGIVATRQCSLEQRQIYINEGRYREVIREFACVIEAQPTEVEGYRGRSEAELLLGRYSVTFATTPHNRLRAVGLSGYAARLAAVPDDYFRSHRRELRSLVLFRLSCGDPVAQ